MGMRQERDEVIPLPGIPSQFKCTRTFGPNLVEPTPLPSDGIYWDPTDESPWCWSYSVTSTNTGEGYEARFSEVGEDKIMPRMLRRRGDKLNGITDRIFEDVVDESKRQLVSSTRTTSQKVFGNEYRTQDASDMWDRFVVGEKASYNEDEDRYYWGK
ncbi:MAG: hypothetical protein AUK47_25020 [Deltaproteobacteria bacterium CG2_30_63_29]|nr:MAG: hypothetical protein AUK47_25020 [Deltaproteobacteria bacterium CG2_30_63_29]